MAFHSTYVEQMHDSLFGFTTIVRGPANVAPPTVMRDSFDVLDGR